MARVVITHDKGCRKDAHESAQAEQRQAPIATSAVVVLARDKDTKARKRTTAGCGLFRTVALDNRLGRRRRRRRDIRQEEGGEESRGDKEAEGDLKWRDGADVVACETTDRVAERCARHGDTREDAEGAGALLVTDDIVKERVGCQQVSEVIASSVSVIRSLQGTSKRGEPYPAPPPRMVISCVTWSSWTPNR
jgi:hypothetical protein